MRSRLALAFMLALGCTPTAEAELVVAGTCELDPLAPADGITLRERGYSLYAFGRSVWLFGDTQLSAPDAQGSSERASSWSHTLDLEAQDGIGPFTTPSDGDGGPAELFPLTAEELAFNQASTGARLVIWPLTGARDDQSDRVLLFYAKVRVSEAGARTPIGSSIAVWTELELDPVRPVLDAGSEEPTLLFVDPEPAFGQAALILEDQVYAYGCANTLAQPCTLARVELAAVFERGAWEFWTGDGWSTSLADAQPPIEADAMFSVHYNPHVDRYLAVYGRRETNEIVLRSAAQPQGPWSPPVRVLQAETAIADVVAHPEFRRGAGQFEVLSYRSGAELRMVEIELAPAD